VEGVAEIAEIAEMIEDLEDLILKVRARLMNVVVNEDLPADVRQELMIALGKANMAYNLVLNLISKVERAGR